MHWTDDINELDRMRREWLVAVSDHNRLLRGIVSGLGLMVFALGLYVVVVTFLGKACH